jgi:transposase
MICGRTKATWRSAYWCDARIAAHFKSSGDAQKALALSGVGPVTASAVVATVGDFKQFQNGAQFVAWSGLTLSQHSSGSKARLGAMTKRGEI